MPRDLGEPEGAWYSLAKQAKVATQGTEGYAVCVVANYSLPAKPGVAAALQLLANLGALRALYVNLGEFLNLKGGAGHL